MRKQSFAENAPRLFTPLLCDGVTLHDVNSFDELVFWLRDLQRERADCRILTSLDDLGQAGYTSGHCISSHGLDETMGHDLAGLSAACFEDGEHLGYLSTPAEFPIRLTNLVKLANGTSLADAAGALDWASSNGGDIFSANAEPDKYVLVPRDRDFVVQFVPVARAADALAAFPNGYFTCDLNPAQNHAIARHLEDSYGFGLFAVGASYLGFWRDEPLDAAMAEALANDVAGLYVKAPADARVRLASLITDADVLLLRYSES